MPDIFISYSHADVEFASRLQKILQSSGLDAFMAQTSIRPGDEWSPKIKAALRAAPLVVFLASADSCQSRFVQQELGGAVFGDKEILPVLIGVMPESLPGWAAEAQALELRDMTDELAFREILTFLTSVRSPRLDLSAAVTGAVVLAHVVSSHGVSEASAEPTDSGPPRCPNCSSAGRPFFMSPIPREFRSIEEASHECSKCGYKAAYDKT